MGLGRVLRGARPPIPAFMVAGSTVHPMLLTAGSNRLVSHLFALCAMATADTARSGAAAVLPLFPKERLLASEVSDSRLLMKLAMLRNNESGLRKCSASVS